MTYAQYLEDKALQKIAGAYVAKHGGRFVGGEPDGGLVYLTADGETAYTPPDGATADQVRRDLKSGKPLKELWPELEFDPELLY